MENFGGNDSFENQNQNGTPSQNSWNHNEMRPNVGNEGNGRSAMSVAKFTPTNMPPEEASGSGPLNKYEVDYLERIANQNYLIKKTTKRYSKSSITSEARALSKVRRMYTAKVGHRYFGFPFKKVRDLRDRAGSNRIASFGAAARKTKRLVLTIVIVFAILATIGTGAAVAVMAINNKNENFFDAGKFVITDTTKVPAYINNYILGQKIDLPILVKNRTGQDVEVRFYIAVEVLPDSDLERAVANGLVDLSSLQFTYYYSQDNWRMSEGMLYYVGTNGRMPDSDEEVEVISGFSIDIPSPEESNKWVNYSMRLNFIVEFDEIK